MQFAIELMRPGVPVTDCAIMLPRVSNTPANRSTDSAHDRLNDAVSAAACSLQTDTSRSQNTSRTTGSIGDAP